jgi:hypothetical protein
MGVVQRLGDLADDVYRAPRRHCSRPQSIVGVSVIYELHCDPQLTVIGRSPVVDREIHTFAPTAHH